MPYDKNSDLPDWVQKSFPADIQNAYREAFNSALKTYDGDEGKAAAVAISQVQKMGYVKKGENWVKAEAGYRKDLLYVGDFPHPQRPGETVHMTLQKLEEISANTNKFIGAGGKVPMTVSHPTSKEEKIANTEGFMNGAYIDYGDEKLYGLVSLHDKSGKWVKDGKLKSVSPGVFHKVTTSEGEFPVLIDHVALTASPHLLKQDEFIPINAESFDSAEIFFENHCVSYETRKNAMGDFKVWFENTKEKVSDWFNAKGIESEKQGGEEMELKELQNENTTLKADIAKRDKTLVELQEKVSKHEKAEKTRLEAEAASRKTKFDTRVEKLIKEKKLKPANREKVQAEYEQLKGIDTMTLESKPVVIEDYILGRYETPTPSTTIPFSKYILKLESGRTMDVESEEGEKELVKLAEARAKELTAENDNVEDWHELYEQAYEEVYAKYVAKNEEEED